MRYAEITSNVNHEGNDSTAIVNWPLTSTDTERAKPERLSPTSDPRAPAPPHRSGGIPKPFHPTLIPQAYDSVRTRLL